MEHARGRFGEGGDGEGGEQAVKADVEWWVVTLVTLRRLGGVGGRVRSEAAEPAQEAAGGGEAAVAGGGTRPTQHRCG